MKGFETSAPGWRMANSPRMFRSRTTASTVLRRQAAAMIRE
jgi:hypothetical protein